MTKPRVQREIGYWVDGKLRFKPEPRPKPEPEPAHVKRNAQRRSHLRAMKAAKERRRWAEVGVPTSELADLMNASKVGSTHGAFLALGKLAHLVGMPDATPPRRFREVVRILYTPDADERTALYYAAHAGHVHLAQIYMSLFVVTRATSPITYRKVRKKFGMTKSEESAHTYRAWFEGLEYGPCWGSFGRADFDLCVLNALNEGVRAMMTRHRVTICGIVRIVFGALPATPGNNIAINVAYSAASTAGDVIREADMKCAAEKVKKAARPKLNMDDSFEPVFDEIDLHSLEEEEESGFATEEGGRDAGTGQDGAAKCSEGCEEHCDEVKSSTETGDDDDNEEEWEVASVSSIFEHLSINEGAEEEASHFGLEEQDWEVLSDVRSVKSINSLSSVAARDLSLFSYRDILLRPASPLAVGKMNTQGEVSLSDAAGAGQSGDTKAARTEALASTDAGCDAFFDRDGAKGVRGGRKGRMFKGNQRTQKATRTPFLYDDMIQKRQAEKRRLRSCLKRISEC